MAFFEGEGMSIGDRGGQDGLVEEEQTAEQWL
jgi:hypothetical protein